MSTVGGSFWRRAASVTALGLVGLASVGVIYWNWYAFPDAFFGAQALDVLGGWLLVGCVLAALAPRRTSGGDTSSGVIGGERTPT